MNNMKNVTWIIPVHKFNKTIGTFLKHAVDSISKMEGNGKNTISIVGPESIQEKVKKICENAEFIVNSGKTDMATQVNAAVMQCVTPYFSVIEIYDTFKPYWNVVAQEYAVNGESVILPIVELKREDKIVSMGNTIAWSPSFANEIGMIDLDCLNTYMDFNVTGALIKTEDFISLGALKPSLKIAAWYEFLLRAAYNGKKILVVPKIGYTHTIGEENDYMAAAYADIKPEEGGWLIETAKKEYFFKEDRNLKFDK